MMYIVSMSGKNFHTELCAVSWVGVQNTYEAARTQSNGVFKNCSNKQ